MIVRNNVCWYWCPHHRLTSPTPGCYCFHTPVDHDKWLQGKQLRRTYKSNPSNQQPTSSKSTQSCASVATKENNSSTLKLDPKFKQVLMTKLDLSPELMDHFLDETMQHYNDVSNPQEN